MHFITGLPVRATPNQEMSWVYMYVKKKDKMVDGAPRRLCMSHPHLNVADFWGEGTGHFRSSGREIWRLVWMSTNSLHGVIGPISMPNDYINTAFNVAHVVSLHGSCRNKWPFHGPHRKCFNLLQFFLCMWKVFPYKERNMLFVDRLVN